MKFSKTLSFLAVTLGVGIIALEAQPAAAKTTTHAVPTTLQGTWFGKYHDALFGNVPVKYRLTKYSFRQGSSKASEKADARTYYVNIKKYRQTKSKSYLFKVASKANSHGYWKLTLLSQNQPVYLKHVKHNGKTALKMYYKSSDTHKAQTSYFYHQ